MFGKRTLKTGVGGAIPAVDLLVAPPSIKRPHNENDRASPGEIDERLAEEIAYFAITRNPTAPVVESKIPTETESMDQD